MDLTRDETREAPAAPTPVPAGAPGTQLPYAVATWLQRVDAAAHPKAKLTPVEADPKQSSHRLIYVLAPTSGGRHVALCLYKARLRPNGDVAAATPISEVFSLLSAPPTFLEAGDDDLIRFFVAMRSGPNSQTGTATEPRGKIGAALLTMLSTQGKLLWANSWADVGNGMVYPMKAGPLREANLAWREEGKGLRLGWQVEPPEGARHPGADQIDYMLPTDPPWYIDNLSCGELYLNQGGSNIALAELQALVAQAPLLMPNDKMRVSQLLLAHGLQHLMPLPQQLPQRLRKDVQPRPILLLDSAQLADGSVQRWNDYAVLSYDYDGERVSFDPAQRVVRQRGDVTEIIQRNEEAEAAALHTLTELGFRKPNALPLSSVRGGLLLASQADWIRFAEAGIETLRAAGWQVEKSVKYRYDLSAVGDWYAEVEEEGPDSGNAWFELELGITVGAERVPLLPVLVQMIRTVPQDFNIKALAAHADADQMLATLPDGSRVALPWKRVKPILATLGELYFSEKVRHAVRMATLDAARLDELARNIDFVWTGGEELRAMGRRLNQFASVQRIATPAGLQATLRDYQTEGLSWMQFLREYGLAGILADDMGLGKTVQTLAHILVEKEAGRLTHPALVIAPTSLMGNWQDEAARFAPGLKVLLLQGKDRAQMFDQIPEADLVLTTYALLPRDEEKLREHDFHLVILDESHYIKNTRSKAAQSAGLLRAKHRLCLSGTPLENHLGELWSQFHFLLPGLLGDEKTFNTQFRHPIERQDDPLRRALLNRRIKPFLLRRTKDSVAKELPPKTEMVRKVELSGGQRDLYETVRLAMDQKVREEIDRKGVARSQIVILEALLKLRQVCCDPRLVKSLPARKQQAAGSAKLADLMQMVEDLLEENRKILVFSQFTSMLELIEEELDARDIPYAILTGETKDRGAQVAAFQQGAVPIFLISLKAGGVGLNLTAADTVIHYDPWWNPAAENQATDRAWRIGQDKPVFVYKLIAKGTLEEKIQVLQQKKADLAQSVLAEGESQKLALTQEDLQQIFAPLVD
ncbi:DEAD/DEAH box helicase [Pseudoduganella violacea]|uniref:Superfamily II DNA or RNA helicase n=1 Tax=Pseudoduganella violacea TaxID=1715466 RepID=A0A7W5FS49_9BURK|nr:DEAD/DEAH box helicase [Pseudoduganella violacea]MBB3117409.1 superfamily II DNA or RNA helicase [Pseudoduganella violacea]